MSKIYDSVYEELNERGLIKQVTFEGELKNTLKSEKVSLYLGIDPTASSIHIGHFIPLMLMSYFQKHGHTPIVLIGGGTAMIGDPSGKSDMRQMLTKEDIAKNVENIKKQVSKFISFEGENKAIIVNNADWILDLNYMDFISTYGIHFNINKMLAAECFKMRMEKGLTFFELNYMLMQSYDFLRLFEDNNCRLQIGGDDQWSNMLSGVDLIRKLHKTGSYCMTCPLLLNSDGVKMGKTVSGALWLDSAKTSPYEFYQYWRNIGDADVNQVLRMLTHLDLDEINKLSSLEGEEINKAKKIAAFEITKLIHGEKEALLVEKTSEDLFVSGKNSDSMPELEIDKSSFSEGSINILDLIVTSCLAPSKGQSRILVNQGGICIDDEKIIDDKHLIDISSFDKGYVVLKKGKKVFIKILVK